MSSTVHSPQSTVHSPFYEQGASKQRIVRYWVRWLGWAGLMPVIALATPVDDIGSDTGGQSSVPMLMIRGSSSIIYIDFIFPTFLSNDYNATLHNAPILAALPDDATTPGLPASFYSFATPITSTSIPPDVTCSAPNNGNPTKGTYRTAVTLGDGESCNITVTPQANGDQYADIVYTGVLSRTGNVYKLTGGSVCGGPYTACAPPPAPIPASIFNFNKPAVIYSKEINVTE